MELWAFLGGGFAALLVLACPRIQPGGQSGQSIRDPRAMLDAGDRLGRR